VWHVLSVSSVSRLGEQPLQGTEDVLVCALRGFGVLRAAVQMVAVGIDGQVSVRAFVMFELLQVRDIQSQVLTEIQSCCTFVLLKVSDWEKTVG
jgi:hypothetical protein